MNVDYTGEILTTPMVIMLIIIVLAIGASIAGVSIYFYAKQMQEKTKVSDPELSKLLGLIIRSGILG